MTQTRGYQLDYSRILPEAVYDKEAREKKAKTIIAVLKDYIESDLKRLSVLDIGCSTGFITNYLSNYFGFSFGIDIDESAIEFAKQHFVKDKLEFIKNDSQQLRFTENAFDAVICAHVYEHVPDAGRLFGEIFRVLKSGGICYFAAGNRISIMEPHYNLPFLSMLPRPIAHLYVRALRKSSHYYEKHLTYWGLEKLVCAFEKVDYTKKIIREPKKFHAEYMIPPDSLKARLAKAIIIHAYFLFPTYIWLLRKP